MLPVAAPPIPRDQAFKPFEPLMAFVSFANPLELSIILTIIGLKYLLIGIFDKIADDIPLPAPKLKPNCAVL